MTTIPVGGTTGHDHESSATIDEAARWLVSQPMWPSPIVPTLNAIFGLSPKQACQAIREATAIRGRAM